MFKPKVFVKAETKDVDLDVLTSDIKNPSSVQNFLTSISTLYPVGFVAHSEAEVHAAYEAALKAGVRNKISPGPQEYYDLRYYAAQVMDPDGYTLEFVYKSWQH